MKLRVINLGEKPENVDFCVNLLMDVFNFDDFEIIEDKNIEEFYDESRDQYHAGSLLKYLYKNYKLRDDYFVIGLTSKDLFEYGLNFVFGESYIGEMVCVLSSCRLYPEFYGLEPDESLFKERYGKEILHEVGHGFGLDHCENWNCVMHFSNSIYEVDMKGKFYCEKCREIIKEYLRIK